MPSLQTPRKTLLRNRRLFTRTCGSGPLLESSSRSCRRSACTVSSRTEGPSIQSQGRHLLRQMLQIFGYPLILLGKIEHAYSLIAQIAMSTAKVRPS